MLPRIADALAPGNEFLRTLLVKQREFTTKVSATASGSERWVIWMRPSCCETVDRPPCLDGRISARMGIAPDDARMLTNRTSISLGDAQQWLDLWRHLVASHHGHLRPWISNHGFSCEVGKQQQSVLRLESRERFSRCSVSSARGTGLPGGPDQSGRCCVQPA